MEARTTAPAAQVVCDGQACRQDATRDFYVHTADGEVGCVTSVTEVHVTEQAITFRRAHGKPVVLPRKNVFYTCCRPDRPPAEF